MATNPEYAPELDQSVLDAIRRKIQEERQQQIAEARGSAISSGLSLGSGYEAVRTSLADRSATNAETDAMVQMSLERARMAREERLGQIQRDYQSLEAQKQRAFEGGQADLAREYEGQQADLQRQFEEAQQNKAIKAQGISDIAGLGGNIVGMYAAKKFGLFGGSGAPAATTPGVPAAGAPAVGGVPAAGGGAPAAWGSTPSTNSTGLFASRIPTLSGGSMSPLGAAAGFGGGSYLGQLGANGIFKNKKTEKYARAGATAGAGVGTALFGPVGGLVGGQVGQLATGGVIGATKAIKKLFCFDPSTEVLMADGTSLPISMCGLGSVTKGGVVLSIRQSITAPETRFSYRGITVTGSHAVREHGRWIRVEDSSEAKPIEGAGLVISLVTTKHRIYVGGIEFADEHETDYYENFSIDQSLAYLNLTSGVLANGK